MSESRKMLDVIREDWSVACDGDEWPMSEWAIKWGNPLMDALERRVLNTELQEECDRYKLALEFYADEKNYLTIHAENPAPNVVMDDGEKAREALKPCPGTEHDE